MTEAAVETNAKPDPSRRLARKVMPFIAADSALLPTDKWIIATLKDMYKTIAPFKRDVRAAGVAAAVGVGGLIASVGVMAVLATAGVLTVASGLGAAVMAVSSASYAVWRGKTTWARAQEQTLPLLKEEIGKRYAKYKIDEVANAWRARIEAQRTAKAAGVAPSQPQPAKKSLREVFARKPANTDAEAPAQKNAAPKTPKP